MKVVIYMSPRLSPHLPPLPPRFSKDVTSCVWALQSGGGGEQAVLQGKLPGGRRPHLEKVLGWFLESKWRRKTPDEGGWGRKTKQATGNAGFMELANLNSNIKNAFISLLNPEKFFLA